MLNTLRVLELEGIGPAPFAGMMLADLGAEVIVVHRPRSQPLPGLPERSLLDRGKRSIELDLKSDHGRKAVLALAKTADVLIEGFRPGVTERLGLGPQDCQAMNPGLVYGRVTGWGQKGPRSQQAGHDYNYLSRSGAAWITGVAGGPPAPGPTLLGDIGGGALYLVAGVLAGVVNARATGRGVVVDAAMIDGSAHMMNLLMAVRQGGGLTGNRGESMLDGAHFSRFYRTSDGGYISVQALEPKFYETLLDRLDLSEDPDFAQQFNRTLWPSLAKRLEDIFSTQDRDAWAELFDGSDACVATVLTPDEAATATDMAERGIWSTPDGALQAAPAPRFDGQLASPGPIPSRGQHTEEILAELTGSNARDVRAT